MNKGILRPDNPASQEANSRATAARLRYMGLALCKPDPGEKKPTYKAWSTTSLEPREFGPNDPIGILGGPLSDCNKPGHALVMIDLDALSAITQADSFLPTTGMEEGRPGKPRDHRYYLVPFDTIPKWAESPAEQAAAAAREKKGHPGPWKKGFDHAETAKRVIDFIGTGGQVVCPPVNGREWIGGEPGEPAVIPFPDLWRAACKLASACGCKLPKCGDLSPADRKAFARAERAAQRNGDWTPERRAIAYLGACPPAISGEGGHNALFRAARGIVYGFDLGAERGFQLLAAHYNPTCQPAFSEREVRHKATQADTVPFGKPRGYLLNGNRHGLAATQGGGNGPAIGQGPPSGGPPPSGLAPPGARQPLQSVDVILDFWKSTYRPKFRRAHLVVCANGLEVSQFTAGAGAPRALLERMKACTDAPLSKDNTVSDSLLPGHFKKWAPTAWAELLELLPEEDAVKPEEIKETAEQFRRWVYEAMLVEVTLGDVKSKSGLSLPERRSLIDWCVRFAKDGPWRRIRSKECWCRIAEDDHGEMVVQVAIRHALFSQLVGAAKQLRDMGPTTFTRRAATYNVGTSDRDNRPHGMSAVVLNRDLMADLMTGLSGEDKEGDEEDS